MVGSEFILVGLLALAASFFYLVGYRAGLRHRAEAIAQLADEPLPLQDWPEAPVLHSPPQRRHLTPTVALPSRVAPVVLHGVFGRN
jgi:hypothetical protein